MMRNALKIVIALSFIMVLGCAAVFAADTPNTDGVYDVSVEAAYNATVTVVPQDESGQNVTGSDAAINDSTVTFYPGAVKFKVTYANAAAGTYYLNLTLNDGSTVPTESNIVYIDQNGTAEFTVYPSSLEAGKTYSICLSSSGSDFPALVKVASFKVYRAYLLGDADPNWKINVNDAMAVINHVSGSKALTGNALLAADVTCDNRINVNDIMAIINYISKTNNEYNLKG